MIAHSRPSLGPREAAAAARVVRSGQVALGPETAAFEREAARYIGVRAAAAAASGTAALELALRAMRVGAGHEVLIPAYSCSALWHAVVRAGAEPVLVDSEPGGDNADMKDAARRLTRRTKAIILVHLFGLHADAEGARALGVPILEDCAGALGGAYRGKRLGGIGKAAVLSFFATKLLTSGGEGGMIVSRDRALVERARDLREYDEKPADRPRGNAKLTDLQAAVGRVQLSRLDSFLRKRAELAAAYDEAFRDLPVRLPPRVPGRVYFRYVIRIGGGHRDSVMRRLARSGIGARVPVYRPLHLDAGGKFPQAERAWRESLSIPIYPSLTAAARRRVIAAVKAAVVSVL